MYEEGDRVIGFIDINHEIYFPEDADNIIWLVPDLKEQYFHGKESIVLHHIATEPDSRKRGVAVALFDDAVKQLRNSGLRHLFSIVTTGPLTNCPSIVWHTKMGFMRACVTMPIDILGLVDYTSLLFYKEL